MSEGTGNNTYTQEQMEQLAQAAAKAATDSLLQQLNLDNRIENASSDTLEGKGISRVPPKRLQANVKASSCGQAKSSPFSSWRST